MRANAISRLRTQPDPPRMFARVRLPARLSPTVTDTQTVLNFPDPEEVTGSNPVRPTSSQRFSSRNTRLPALRSVGLEASVRGLSGSCISPVVLPRLLVLAERLISGNPSSVSVCAADDVVRRRGHLILPFAMTDAKELLEALAAREATHAALLADILDVLGGSPLPPGDHAPRQARNSARASCCRRISQTRDRGRALDIAEHRQHAYPQDLCPARCRQGCAGRRDLERAAAWARLRTPVERSSVTPSGGDR